MKAKTAALIGLGLASATAALFGANLVAGGALFALYKQDPRGADSSTLTQAWQSQPNKPTRRKIVISMLVGGGLCIGLPVGLIVAATSTRRQLHGSARFAHHGDIKASGLRSTTGILLGKQGGQFLRLPGFEFVLLAAPTRTGKGTCFVIPNLLTFEGSCVVQDIKGENHALTAEYRRTQMGNEVYCWNPFSEHSHRSNPLSYIAADPKLRISDVQILAATLYADQPKESPIWVESARNLFLGLVLLVLETPELPQTLGEVLRQASGKGEPLQDYLGRVLQLRAKSGRWLSAACVDALNRFLGASENTLKGILATFLAPLSIWANPLVDKATSGDDFDVRALRRRPMSVYVCVPAREMVGAGLLMNLFYSVLIGENLREQPQDNPDLKLQALLMMDEFTAMDRVPIIAKGVSFMASYNLRLAIVIQDTAQLLDVYGKESGHNILSNMGATIHFAPNDLEDARRLSELAGYTTERARSHQYSNNASSHGGSSGRTLTVSEQRRALLLPQEMRALDSRKQLIVRTGMPVILCDKAPYHADPVLMKLFAQVPGRTVIVNGETRTIPVQPAPPPARWEAYEQALAGSDFYARQRPDGGGTDLEIDEQSLLDAVDRQLASDERLDARLQPSLEGSRT